VLLKDINRYRLRPEQLFAYRGHALVLTDSQARIADGDEGFYFRRTRFLSRLILKVNGKEPSPASANPVEPHSLIAYHLAPSPAGHKAGPEPRKRRNSGGEIARKGLEIQTNTYVGGGLHQDIHITNHGLADTSVTLSWELDADFADQTEAEQGKRQQQAQVERSWAGRPDGNGGELGFSYRHPRLNHATTVRLLGEGRFTGNGTAVSCRLGLQPQETCTLSLDVIPSFFGARQTPFYGRDGMAVQEPSPDALRDEWAAGCTRLSTENASVQEAWDRAISDLASLHLLDGRGAERFTPAAGVPKYTALFGRDALMAAWQSTLLNPMTLRGTLSLVGSWNAEGYDDAFDAQPGKVVHQRQLSPLAVLGKTPFAHYYGDYSAPALFLLGLVTDLMQTGDQAFLLSMRDKALDTLAWMDRDGDLDGDGFYEYRTRAGASGLKNQGWKDSEQAILYENGLMVDDPIAICEIQGLYYAAKQAMGLAFATLGEHERSHALLAEAARLKQRFNERFWMQEERYFALALDPDKRPVRTIASNPGACLAYGIIDPDKAPAVAERLMAADMFSGWGIRTLSSRHPAYNPLAYHLGTVWPSPNAVIGHGLKRYGFNGALHRLAEGLFSASRLFHLDRLPEVFGGHPRDPRHPHPGIYPGACAPQAWSASAVVLLMQSMLGITPLAPLKTLIVDPSLPAWLPEVTIEAVQVGTARVNLRFRRDPSGRTEHQVLEACGDLRIRRPEPRTDADEVPQDGLEAIFEEILATYPGRSS
jgi:glycogen debranching enzyme